MAKSGKNKNAVPSAREYPDPRGGVLYSCCCFAIRIIYPVFAAVPFVVGAVNLLWIFTAELPVGFESGAEFIGDLISGNVDVVLKLAVNLIIYLALCCWGFVLVRRKWVAHDKRLLIMAAVGFSIFIIQQPIVYGVMTIQFFLPVSAVLSAPWGIIVWGLIQPQSLLTAITVVATLFAYRRPLIGERCHNCQICATQNHRSTIADS